MVARISGERKPCLCVVNEMQVGTFCGCRQSTDFKAGSGLAAAKPALLLLPPDCFRNAS